MSEAIQTHETPAPRYTENDENGFAARLESFQKTHPDYPIIPVTKYPSTPELFKNRLPSLSSTTESWQSAGSDAHGLQADIVTALFASISAADTAAAAHLITQGLISPDCPKATGETALLASVRARSAATARALLLLGADPDLAGRAGGPDHGAERTPLMLAAATGQLAVVRMLVGEFGADDAAVGPRGETALRLAAEAGHRDVVRYLPARRGGAWRRLKHSKEVVALRRAAVSARKAVRFFGWDLPRLLLVDIPWEVGKWVWRRRHCVGPWVVRVVRGTPRGLIDLAKAIWMGLKRLPRLLWRVVLWISEVVSRAWEIMRKGLVDGAKNLGRAVVFAARRLVSVLHSSFAAIITRLKGIKLKDVGHDLLVAMEALFVKLPRAVWAFVSQSVVMAGRAFKTFFSNSWIRTLLKVLCIVPQILWLMLESMWASFGRGLDELITLANPKRIPSGGSRS
ncbi:hypothetical protein INS49_013585 [Diaporthe citri]|uniref:uncharacterized protein n=1 Tax=Diaporthe citri TaxID=83186 RepID=UPI001C8239DB|nr:uncharacterized protein INS49_013585 [Diaporthe citri]KAG6357706.1 hypothetical protein INS49_013585 [Diaporthe citri]